MEVQVGKYYAYSTKSDAALREGDVRAERAMVLAGPGEYERGSWGWYAPTPKGKPVKGQKLIAVAIESPWGWRPKLVPARYLVSSWSSFLVVKKAAKRQEDKEREERAARRRESLRASQALHDVMKRVVHAATPRANTYDVVIPADEGETAANLQAILEAWECLAPILAAGGSVVLRDPSESVSSTDALINKALDVTENSVFSPKPKASKSPKPRKKPAATRRR